MLRGRATAPMVLQQGSLEGKTQMTDLCKHGGPVFEYKTFRVSVYNLTQILPRLSRNFFNVILRYSAPFTHSLMCSFRTLAAQST